MRPQGTLLRRRWIQREPVRLDNLHATPQPAMSNQLIHPPSQEHLTFPAPHPPAHSTPRRRRRTLHTQARQTTPPPSHQPAAAPPRPARPALLRPAARARQPRSMRARGPAAVTTRPAASPSPAAHAVTLATCQSRSDHWPAEETRAYTAASPAGTGTGTGTASTRISRPARLAGTGSPPPGTSGTRSRDGHPARGRSFKFTHAFCYILNKQ